MSEYSVEVAQMDAVGRLQIAIKRIEALETQLAAERAMSCKCWLIEGAGVYWRGHSPSNFGADANDAVRFARREDAERILHWIVPESQRILCRTAEHVWLECKEQV
jgi:hypothetical protein